MDSMPHGIRYQGGFYDEGLICRRGA
jgi:hypothetical protein